VSCARAVATTLEKYFVAHDPFDLLTMQVERLIARVHVQLAYAWFGMPGILTMQSAEAPAKLCVLCLGGGPYLRRVERGAWACCDSGTSTEQCSSARRPPVSPCRGGHGRCAVLTDDVDDGFLPSRLQYRQIRRYYRTSLCTSRIYPRLH